MFDRPSSVPQTNLEIMLFGDRWKRAVDEADRRLQWPRAAERVPGGDQLDTEGLDAELDDEDLEAWIGEAG